MSAADLSPDACELLARGAKLLPAPVAKLHDIMCGCGDPEAVWAWVLAYLRGMDGRVDAWKPETGPDYLAAYLLDDLGLTEHGTTIRASWLTPLGRQTLAFLEENGADWPEKGWWIDADGCTHSTFEHSGEPA